MTAQLALRTALRDIVSPAARGEGFKGSAPNWRLTNAQGDWAVTNVQSSMFSSSEDLRCVINLAVAPAPWLAWKRETLGGLPKNIDESLGLYRARLNPLGTPPDADGWWRIRDSREATAAAEDMVQQLTAVGWPTIKRLMDRGALLEQVRSGDLGLIERSWSEGYFVRAEAVLIASDGPSPRLGGLLADLSQSAAEHEELHVRRFIAWVRKYAAQQTE